MMVKMDKTNSNRIYFLYLTMAFLIVQIHSYGITILDENIKVLSLVKILDLIKRVMTSAGVPVFFFMSGYFFFRTSRHYDSYIVVMKKKCKTILIPLLLWSVVGCVYAISISLIFRQTTFSEISVLNVIHRVLFLEDNPILWFMRAIFIFQCIYPVLEKLLQYKKLAIASILIVCVVNALIGPTKYYGTCHYWFPQYFTGALIGRYYDDFFLNWKKIYAKYEKLIYIGAIGLFVVLFTYCALDIDGLGIYIYRLFIVFPVWIVFGLVEYTGNLSWPLKCSMYICSSHVVLCGLMSKIYFRVLGRGVFQSILGYLIVPVGIIVTLLLIAVIWKKLFPTLWDVFNGARQ